MNIINFSKRIVSFLIFLILFYSGYVFLWGIFLPSGFTKNLNFKKGLYGHLYSRLQDLKTYGDVDVLFLGSSHAYRGFDPRIFKKHGIKSFNLGSSAQTPIQTEILLTRYLNSLNPRLIVFEVYPEILMNEGIESALDLISNDRLDFLSIKMALDLNHIKVYNTLIYRIIRELLQLDSGFIEPIHKAKFKDTYVKGGFVEKEISFYNNSEVHPIKKWILLEKQKNTLERIIKHFKKLNIKVILVQSPLTKELYDSYSNNAEIDAYFKSLSEYYNFNEILTLSSKHFHDSDHLNSNGVEIFNTTLLNTLKHNSLLCRGIMEMDTPKSMRYK